MAGKVAQKNKPVETWVRFTDAVAMLASDRFGGEWDTNEALAHYPFRMEKPEGSRKVQPVRHIIRDPSEQAEQTFRPKALVGQEREAARALGCLRKEAREVLQQLIEAGKVAVRLNLKYAPSIEVDALFFPMIFGQLKSLETTGKVRLLHDGEWHVATVVVAEQLLRSQLSKEANSKPGSAGLPSEVATEVDAIISGVQAILDAEAEPAEGPAWPLADFVNIIEERASVVFCERDDDAANWAVEVRRDLLISHIERRKIELQEKRLLAARGRMSQRRKHRQGLILERLDAVFPKRGDETEG